MEKHGKQKPKECKRGKKQVSYYFLLRIQQAYIYMKINIYINIMSQHDLKHKYVRSNNTNNLSFPHFTHSLTSLTYSLSLIHIQSHTHKHKYTHTDTLFSLSCYLIKKIIIYINGRMYEWIPNSISLNTNKQMKITQTKQQKRTMEL